MHQNTSASNTIRNLVLILGLVMPTLCLCIGSSIILAYDLFLAEDQDSIWLIKTDEIETTLEQKFAGASIESVKTFLDQNDWDDCSLSKNQLFCSKRVHKPVINQKNPLKSNLNNLLFKTYLSLEFYFKDNELSDIQVEGYFTGT